MVNPSKNSKQNAQKAQTTQKAQQNVQDSNSQKFNDEFQFYPQTLMTDYFNSINKTSIQSQKSDLYTYQRYINVTQLLFNGDLNINPQSFNIDPLLANQKITQQQERTNQLKAKKASILSQLSLLDEQLSKSRNKKIHDVNFSMDVSRLTSKDNDEDNLSTDKTTKKLVLSKDQHKQLVMKIVKQREQRQKSRSILKQKQQEKLKKLQQEQKNNQLKKIQEQKRKKAQEIQEKLKKNKEKHEKFLRQEKQSVKKIQEVKNKKFLHEEIQEKFQMNVKMPLLEEQKKLLKQKRQFVKAYSIDQIKNHQRAYLQLRENSIQKSQARQLNHSSKQSYKAPHKSSRLQKILEQQKVEQRQRLMEKKRAIEQKLQRQQNYVEYLKENFSKVKIDKNKEQEIKSRIQKTKVKRQEIDLKSIGINYLQQAKRLRRKTPYETNNLTQKEDVSKGQNQGNLTVLSQQSKKPKISQSRISDDMRGKSLIKKRQQKIQILINDTSINQVQRIRKLKMQTDRINEAFRMKQEMLRYGYNEKVEDEAVELLLTSIQAKMGIIDIGKEKLTSRH